MEILLRRKSKTDPDPIKNERLYKRGDIVSIRPDGQEWGRMENPDLHPDGVDGCGFVIIKVPGVMPTQKTMDKWLGQASGSNESMVKRRLWGLMIDNLPVSIRNELRDEGSVTVTWNQIKNYMRNKLTDERET